MSTEKDEEFGRVAIRREGDWIKAYFAAPNTMKGATLLAQLRANCAEVDGADGPVFQTFLTLAKAALGAHCRALYGKEPGWTEPRPGPEHERAGRG